jgi:hypothetical protein
MKGKEKILAIVFGIILVLSGIIRFLQTRDGNTAFTYDQARDMLDIRALGEFKDLAILGPTTSINGLRLGPFYYYFNLPAYWVGGGNPQALVYWNIVLFLFSGGFIFWYFRKRNIILGFLVGSSFLMAPQMFNLTRYFWNANMATYLSVYFFVALWNFLEKKDNKSVLWLGLTAALMTQFEAAFGIVCLGFSVLVILLNKKVKHWKSFLIGAIPWFLPQILLDVKNKFQMTKLLLGFFNGSNQVLGDKMSLGETISSHFHKIIGFFEGQFIASYGWGLGVLILAIVLILINKKYRKMGIYFVSFLLFAFVFYTMVYHHELKTWYLESLRVWYCFVIGIGLANINKFKKLTGIIIGIFLVRNIWLATTDQWQFTDQKPSSDPKNLANLIKNVDWVYQKMNGNGFEAYTYVPEIYDYPNQYLYWWYGVKKYDYMPIKVSYSLTEVPEYLRTSNEFYRKTKENKSNKIALIYEINDRSIGWLGQFTKYCTVDKWETDWNTTVEVREKCK